MTDWRKTLVSHIMGFAFALQRHSSRSLMSATVVSTGASCSKERAEEIISLAEERNHELMREWCEMVENKMSHLPAFPLNYSSRDNHMLCF